MTRRFRAAVPTWLGAGHLVRLVLIAAVLFLIGRYWDPYYGFTSLLQADPVTESLLPPDLRDAPIFIHRDAGRYDGVQYAQIATHPDLHDPAVFRATDNLGYRARRILLGAVAWVGGAGDPVRTVHVYAWLNPILWVVFAAVAWRILPVGSARAGVAWPGVVLASGTLVSVRLALTDLAALVLLAASTTRVERGRPASGAGFLALAALARETALLGAVVFWPERGEPRRQWWRAAGLVALATVPLAGWLLYVRSATGSSGPGNNNFAWPLRAWLERGQELWALVATEENRRMLAVGWLDYVGLTVQMIYVLRYPQKESAWWRLGFAFTLLGLCLGTAVWEGLPGASARLLLPVTLAFNVLAWRRRSAWVWLLLGNLTVLGGIWSVAEVPGRPHQLTSRAEGGISYVLETDARWSVAEWNRKWRWAWCPGDGAVSLRVWPHRPRLRVELQVRGVTPRELEVRHAGAVVWRGAIGDRPQWIPLPELPLERGRLDLELHATAPPRAEGADNTARAISVACFGARVVTDGSTGP